MTARPRVAAAAVVLLVLEAALALLVLEAALALLGVWGHYEFTATYGCVGDTALEGLGWGVAAGLSGMALGAVLVVALIAVVLSRRAWMRLAAGALPILMLLGMLVLTPSALRQKAEWHDPAASCRSAALGGRAATAEHDAGRAFDSIGRIG